MAFAWLFLAVLAAALLVAGLATGKMPNAVREPRRASEPVFYWVLGATYGFVELGALFREVAEFGRG